MKIFSFHLKVNILIIEKNIYIIYIIIIMNSLYGEFSKSNHNANIAQNRILLQTFLKKKFYNLKMIMMKILKCLLKQHFL